MLVTHDPLQTFRVAAIRKLEVTLYLIQRTSVGQTALFPVMDWSEQVYV